MRYKYRHTPHTHNTYSSVDVCILMQTPTPGELANVRVPEKYAVRDAIWKRMDTVRDLKTVITVGIVMDEILRAPQDAHEIISAENASVIALLNVLWGDAYVEKLLVTQFISKKGIVLARYTLSELARWYGVQFEGKSRFAPTPTTVVPTSITMRAALETLPYTAASPEMLEQIVQELASVSRTGLALDVRKLGRVVRDRLFFYETIWGHPYTLYVQQQQATDNATGMRTRQVLALLVKVIRERITVLRKETPRQDEIKRLRVQLWVCRQQMRELRNVATRFGRDYKLSSKRNALDLPLHTSGHGLNLTWRNRLETITAPANDGELMQVIQRHDSMFVNGTIGNDMPHTHQWSWSDVLRRLIVREFGATQWNTPGVWQQVAYEAGEVATRDTLGMVSMDLLDILQGKGKGPMEFGPLNRDNVRILRRIQHYATQRAALATGNPTHRTGIYAALSARLVLCKRAISAMVSFLYSFGQFVRGGDIGLPDAYVRQIERIIQHPDALVKRATVRTIASAAMGERQLCASHITCAQVARGTCGSCGAHVCGSRACMTGHECN